MKKIEKGNYSAMTSPMDKKKIQVFLIFILILHTKFQDPISNSSRLSASVTHRRTDGPQPICLLNFFEVGGIKTKAQISCAVTAHLITTFVFRYIDSTIPLLPKPELSAIFCGYTARFVEPGRKPQRQFSLDMAHFVFQTGNS